ncbi:hypothetical protein [Citreimonas salinaria]|uniref:Uncharacterized protein n=1 Tax=Citreimonas salinaria TaxID=321339 RepID=A0A1H3GF70_9RHOB|nr:hypothetical protein [Citreimonas salinaria]SDY01707.1 hypothetical protein SAMN05444340_102307 [Citreimonas salinaria]
MGLKIFSLNDDAVEGVLDDIKPFAMRRSGDVLTARVGEHRFVLPGREYRGVSEMRACVYSVIARYRAATKRGAEGGQPALA